MSSSLDNEQPIQLELTAEVIAPLSLHTTGSKIHLGQAEHRIRLLSQWDITPGARILEIGCGQGDCTVALAVAAGSNGHVTAIDPAPLDYGSPFTLGQAQDHLSSGPLGPRITWVQADPIEFLNSELASDDPKPKYDVAILAHSLWYFDSSVQVLDTLRAAAARAHRVCIAEYALSASEPAAVPHVFAALAQAALGAFNPYSTANIRTILSPTRIKELAAMVNLQHQKESLIVPHSNYWDGRWETNMVKDKAFETEINDLIADEKQSSAVRALRDATIASLGNLGEGVKIRTMDVWIASFSSPN